MSILHGPRYRIVRNISFRGMYVYRPKFRNVINLQGSLEGSISCRAPRLLVCYIVTSSCLETYCDMTPQSHIIESEEIVPCWVTAP
jgi:hypothetical protein